MTQSVVGSARCGTDEQDFAAQREALVEFGLPEDRVYLDGGYAGTNRQQPKLGEALAAAGTGDTFVVANIGAVAKLEANLTKMRTREGMAIGKPKGKLRGRGPNLTASRQEHLAKLYAMDEQSVSEPAEVFSVGQLRAYCVLTRQGS